MIQQSWMIVMKVYKILVSYYFEEYDNHVIYELDVILNWNVCFYLDMYFFQAITRIYDGVTTSKTDCTSDATGPSKLIS